MLIEWHGLTTSRVDAERVPEADVEPVGQHDEQGGNLFAARQVDALPSRLVAMLRPWRRWRRHSPGWRPHAVDHSSYGSRIDVRPLLDEAAAARDPQLSTRVAWGKTPSATPVFSKGGPGARRASRSGSRWIDRMRIDDTVSMPARPSIAAAVEPARPPPTMTTSVCRMAASDDPFEYNRAGVAKSANCRAARGRAEQFITDRLTQWLQIARPAV